MEAGSLNIQRHSGRSGAAAGPAPGARCRRRLCADDSGRPHCRWRPRGAAEARHPQRPAPAAPASCPAAAMWGSPADGCRDCWAHGKSHSLQAGSGRSCPGTTPGDGAGASLQDRREGGKKGWVQPRLLFLETPGPVFPRWVSASATSLDSHPHAAAKGIFLNPCSSLLRTLPWLPSALSIKSNLNIQDPLDLVSVDFPLCGLLLRVPISGQPSPQLSTVGLVLDTSFLPSPWPLLVSGLKALFLAPSNPPSTFLPLPQVSQCPQEYSAPQPGRQNPWRSGPISPPFLNPSVFSPVIEARGHRSEQSRQKFLPLCS